ncbi:hypothetical protein [Chitinilyticum litopenaei]|uniref:hypothetical protein n=1 Tax=Chitinilyticum litopenaei TaxID=1121276 RepID=UPI000421D2CF|nr:hypothetical protein [Chitinilyticum litopenaei]
MLPPLAFIRLLHDADSPDLPADREYRWVCRSYLCASCALGGLLILLAQRGLAWRAKRGMR